MWGLISTNIQSVGLFEVIVLFMKCWLASAAVVFHGQVKYLLIISVELLIQTKYMYYSILKIHGPC